MIILRRGTDGRQRRPDLLSMDYGLGMTRHSHPPNPKRENLKTSILLLEIPFGREYSLNQHEYPYTI